jgi:hypothetical protein
MMTIQQIATTHNIDPNKENFPVNTIRLFYLVLIYSLVQDNPQEKAEQIIKSIPLVSTILSKRTDLRLSGEIKNINQEWLESQSEIEELNKLIPQADQSLTYLFSMILPSQEDLLFNIVSQAQSEGKVFNPTDIISTLKLRAMDSIAYSNLVCQLVNQPEHNLAIHYLTNLIYQVNDLLDSILFAKEDTENNNFSPFEIIRKSAKDSSEAKNIINSLLEKLLSDKNQVKLPEETQQQVDQFFQLLTSILGYEVDDKNNETIQVE